ncbi:MAG: DNA primase [Bacteroidetes bacterium]|nr:DNA primase [Bacteroidota bacterium]
MIISENTIERVRALSIEDVLGTYITIKKNEACCPFHNEKTPSFRINIKKNYYKCFGCGKSGDAIRFVQEVQKLTFLEAIETIAKSHNIQVEYIEFGSEEERKEKISKLETAKLILNYAHDYYRNALANNLAMKTYLLERGFDDDKIEEWQLGFAPNEWKNITTHVINQNWYTVANEIGLVLTSKEQNYDALRNRITIPIFDKHGQIIGFGARAIGDDKPKYLNPNENFLYSKSTILFGLDRAIEAIKKEKYAILVEGYFDVMSMHNAGVENVLAPCGTACDEKQLQLLKRYTDTITIMYDGDTAGQASTTKLLNKALKLGFNTLTVELTDKDPDQLAREYSNQ